MPRIPGYETTSGAGQRRFKKRLIGWIRESIRERETCHAESVGLYLVKEGLNQVRVETKLRSCEDLLIFGKDSSIETQMERPSCDHPDDFPGRPKGRQ
jgi:hypothetical protein